MSIEINLLSGGLVSGPGLLLLMIMVWIIVDKKRGERERRDP
ncbi:MAG TPA: hypothetical protein VGC46_02845 [Allosphingosinicella sp.]